MSQTISGNKSSTILRTVSVVTLHGVINIRLNESLEKNVFD